MLIFTEEIIENNPGLRTYLYARSYLEEIDLDYEDDRTLEEFLKFIPNWLPCIFSDFKSLSLKILRDCIILPNNNPVIKDLKNIINNRYYNKTILNYCMMLLFNNIDKEKEYNYDGEELLNMEDSLELVEILIKLGAIPDQKDFKYFNNKN